MTILSAAACASLQRICVVLVRPMHARNIGATARAMKCMGLGELILVDPARFPDPQAKALAVNAADLLERARVCSSLEQALADARWVYGVSARVRRQSLPVMDVRACVPDALAQATLGRVCFVFGNEEAGLDNADLQLCQEQVLIASNPECASLNLAAAVQVVAHELRQGALLAAPGHQQRTGVGRLGLAPMYARLDQMLEDCGFYANKNRAQVQTRLRAMLERARPDKAELNLMMGMLAQLQRGGSPPPRGSSGD
jgi:TrmH family RNA methyltransferase